MLLVVRPISTAQRVSREIPVISGEQPSPHIEKENQRVEHGVEHGVGHSGPGWKENGEIQLTQLCLIHICWAAEEKKRGEVFFSLWMGNMEAFRFNRP